MGALRDSMRRRGGDLIIRVGQLAPTLLDLLAEAGARSTVTEEEVEYRSASSYHDGGLCLLFPDSRAVPELWATKLTAVTPEAKALYMYDGHTSSCAAHRGLHISSLLTP